MEGFRQYFVLKTFPIILRNRFGEAKKKGKGEEKKDALGGEGRRIFFKVLGKKKEGKGKKKDVQGREREHFH